MAEEKSSGGGGLIALLGFLPWLVYGVSSGAGHWTVATAGGVIVSLPSLSVLRRRSMIKLMDWTALAFFLTAAVLMIGLRSTAFPAYHVIVIWSFFAVAAWGSIIVAEPFTTAYAREQAPPEVWDHPAFRRLNVILTVTWCLIFTVNVGFAVLSVLTGSKLGLGFLLPTALLIFGFVFSRRFPQRYQARSARAEGKEVTAANEN